MANNCFYDLKAVGNKDFLKELLDIMNYRHKDNIFLSRIFSADVVDEWELEDGRSAMWVSGDCAWSVYSCMMEGDHTYYDDWQKGADSSVFINEGTEKLTSIIQESKRLGLDVEIYSRETGFEFAEHYIIKNGEIITNEERPYIEYYFDAEDEEFDTWKKEVNLPAEVTLADFDENGEYIIGGFEEIFEVDSLKRKVA